MLVIILLANQPFFHSLFDRIDFTEDKRFTLTSTSKDLARQVKKDIYITIFLDGNDLPSGFKRLQKAALDMANDFRSYSAGQIKVQLVNPRSGSQQEQQEFTQALLNKGLFPTNLSIKTDGGLSQKYIFPAAIISDGDYEVNVNLLQNRTGQPPEQVLNNSIQNLEYAFASAISKINKEDESYIGFTEGHGEPTNLELYDAIQTLMGFSQVGRVNLDSISYDDLKRLKVLAIVKPTKRFTESEKYKLDFYIRQGGAVIWAIDQIDMSLDYLRNTTSQPLVGRETNLDDQLFLYGVRLNYDIVADLNCAQIPVSLANTGGQSQIELTPWYFFPILMPGSPNPIVRNLDGIRTEFTGTIDTIASKGIKKEIILSSSPFSRVLKTPNSISLQMIEEQPDPAKFKSQPLPIAVLLTGKFPYLFENRPTPKGIETPVDLSTISKEAKQFVIADGDWLINQINSKDESTYPLGWDRYTEQQYANKTLLENIIDYLSNEESLISLRNREVKLRLLDQALVKEQKVKWQVINVAAPVLILLIVGMAQQYLRRRKFTR